MLFFLTRRRIIAQTRNKVIESFVFAFLVYREIAYRLFKHRFRCTGNRLSSGIVLKATRVGFEFKHIYYFDVGLSPCVNTVSVHCRCFAFCFLARVFAVAKRRKLLYHYLSESVIPTVSGN